MPEVPYALALAAGMLAAVNPCGFALLPAYLSLLVAGDREREAPGWGPAVGRALASTAAMTAGFVAVFGTFGVLVTSLMGAVARYLPWFTVAFGLLLVVGGAWLIAGRRLPAPRLAPRRAPTVTRSLPSMAAFGVAYALASLGCTIAPFLAIVGSSARAGSTLAAVGLFTAYAAGMALVVGTAAMAVALARTSVIGRLRRVGPLVSRASGVLLAAAGAYVAYYGWYELRIQRGGPAGTPVIDAAEHVQRRLVSGVEALGAVGWALVFVAFLVVSGAAIVRARRRAARARRDRQRLG